jgi:hypothetical protein
MLFDNNNIIGLYCAEVYITSNKTTVMIAARSLQFLIMLSNVLMLAYMVYYIRTKLQRIATSANVPSSLRSGDAQLIRKLWCLTGCFIVMTFPFFIVFNLSLFVSLHALQTLISGCFVICVLNSALNPVVYVWRFREPRYQLQLLLCFFNEAMKERIRQRRNHSLAEFSMQAYRGTHERNQGQEGQEQNYGQGQEQGHEQGQEQNHEQEQDHGQGQDQNQSMAK